MCNSSPRGPIVLKVCVDQTHSMEQSPREANGTLSWSTISTPFIEPEGLLLCIQESAIGCYSDLDESNPHPQTLLFRRSILILPSHLCLLLPRGIVPSNFPTRSLESSGM
jgi:hypothetical protein